MEKENLAGLEDYIMSINKSITTMQKGKPTKVQIPSNFQIMLSGVTDQIGLTTLFSPKVDAIVGKLFDSIFNGRTNAVESAANNLDNIMDTIGINSEKSFEGPISKTVVDSITNSVNSEKFNSTKSKIRKCLIILKDLERKRSDFEDDASKKKYSDSVYAVKQTLKIVAKILKQRSLITERLKRGLANIVNEDLAIS